MYKKKYLNRKIIVLAKQYLKYINKKGINTDKAFIFGSYAKGKATPDSDIDICVISKDFGKDEISELQSLLYHARQIDVRLEPIPLNDKEFKNKYNSLAYEINKYGIAI